MIWKYITIGMQGKGGEGGKTRITIGMLQGGKKKQE